MPDRWECDLCGLALSDLPDGIDPDLFYERDSGKTWCIVHIGSDVAALFADRPETGD